jgi:hypothetical protein
MVLETLAGLAGALTLASAPLVSAVPPVSVVSCDYSNQQFAAAATGFGEASAPIQTSNLRISFVNQAPLEATDVRFAVSYGGVTQLIDDNGRFATGTPITHDFQPVAAGAFESSAAQCAVQSVTFADGSTWQPS